MKLTEAGSYGLVCFPGHPKTFLRDCSLKKEKPRTRKTGGAPRSAQKLQFHLGELRRFDGGSAIRAQCHSQE